MLWNCCTQYSSKFEKLSSGYRTGNVQFLILIPKEGSGKECSNDWTIAFISPASKIILKSFKLGFNSMGTENFQMHKLDLEKVEEPEIKLPAFIGS